jgi:predicted Rossmann fold flavoprotein
VAPLAGVAVQGRATAGRTGFDEAVLFTHRGLSGPAVLQVSSYWREGDQITLDLARGAGVAGLLKAARAEAGRQGVATVLGRILPERLARFVVDQLGVTGTLGEQSNATLERIAAAVHGWEITPVGSEGYRTAEVTLGGVSTDALDGRTMAARGVPGLYFVGEVVDVTGWLGGYNFQWAWSSGWASGQVA